MPERRSRIATSTLALLSGTTAWLSAGTLALVSGDAERVAALPSVVFLILAMLVAVVAANLARLHLSEAWPLAISFLIWLPFIPGRIPNAFLLWQGPIEGMVWLTVVGGLIYARTWGSPSGGYPAKAGHHKWIAALAVATLALFAFNQVR